MAPPKHTVPPPSTDPSDHHDALDELLGSVPDKDLDKTPPSVLHLIQGLVAHIMTMEETHRDWGKAHEELKVLNKQLQARVDNDPLTGAYSREFLENEGEQILQKIRNPAGRRKGEPLPPGPVTLIAIDMDGFKQINDKVGVKAGDAAIKYLAKFMQTNLREEDKIARRQEGGDEFFILFHGTKAQAEQKIKELRTRLIGEEQFKYTGEFELGDRIGEQLQEAPIYLSFSYHVHELKKKDTSFATVMDTTLNAVKGTDKKTKDTRWKKWDDEHPDDRLTSRLDDLNRSNMAL